MPNSRKIIQIAGLLVGLASPNAVAGERPEWAFDLRPWKVGDKWTVHVNMRESLPIRGDSNESDLWFDRMREEWKAEGKPKGIPFGDWLEKKHAKQPKKNPHIKKIHAKPPYEDWMLCDNCPPSEAYGAYYKGWSIWRFGVVAEKKVSGKRCYAVKARMLGWADGAGKALAFKKREYWQFDLLFSADDRSLVSLKIFRNPKKAHEEKPGGGVPVASVQATRPPPAHAIPAYFPVPALWDYEPNELIEKGKIKPNDLPREAIAQKCRLLADRRLLVTMSNDMASVGKNRHARYAKVLFKRGYPWWTEMYISVEGGVRARLFSVNGEKVRTRLTPPATGRRSDKDKPTPKPPASGGEEEYPRL